MSIDFDLSPLEVLVCIDELPRWVQIVLATGPNPGRGLHDCRVCEAIYDHELDITSRAGRLLHGYHAVNGGEGPEAYVRCGIVYSLARGLVQHVNLCGQQWPG